jgi:hypothetical protein
MNRIVRVLLVAMILIAFPSCSGNKSHRTSNFFDSDETEYVKEEVKDAEKKPIIFYQRLLEKFCQEYYNGCFSGREYHYGSLIVDEMSAYESNYENGHVISWNMQVEGKHSFKGVFSNHNDSPFNAFVDDLGNNSYKVLFSIKRYGPFGQLDEYEHATRTISYSE